MVFRRLLASSSFALFLDRASLLIVVVARAPQFTKDFRMEVSGSFEALEQLGSGLLGKCNLVLC